MTTGQKIQELRKKHNLTQEQLAEIMNVSRQAISKWESDVSFPETENLIVLSNYLECSIDYLLINEPNHPDQSTKQATNLPNEDQSPPTNDNSGMSKSEKMKEELNPRVFTMAWSIGQLVLTLFFMALPVAGYFFGQVYISANGYQILSGFSLSNFIFLTAFLSVIAQAVLSLFIFFDNYQELYVHRIWTSWLTFGLLILLVYLNLEQLGFGIFALIGVSLTHSIGLHRIEANLAKPS